MSIGILNKGQRQRLRWLLIVLATVGGILGARLVFWHLAPPPDIRKFGISGRERPRAVPVARGNILDRTGHCLAASSVTCQVGAVPDDIRDDELQDMVTSLADILGKDERVISRTLSSETTHVSLGSDLPVEVGHAIEDLQAGALDVHYEYSRVYPDGELAASVLGFVNYEGQAYYGLEQYYDAYLKGHAGVQYGVRDRRGDLVLMYLEGYKPALDGCDLQLALDRNVQYEAERLLEERIERHQAASGNIIVMEVQTGAILAMVNRPSYEPARYGAWEYKDLWANTSISWIYEPGSVFKTLTLAAGLDGNVISPDDTYDDRGEIQIGEQRIYNSDRRAHGTTTMTELLAYSRNVGSVHVATLLGETRFYEVLRRFGFGEITGIDLVLEEDGIMYVPGDAVWHKSNLATNSFGQGISTTPLQVVAAFGAIANDGILMRPYVVERVIAPARGEDDPEVQAEIALLRIGPKQIRRVISSEAAGQITELSADAVDLGMKVAVPPGYRVAGKSGTAGVPTQAGYQGRDVIASFVGFGPLPDPRFVVLIKLDKPTKGVWGVEIAAPAFRDMMQYLVDYYGIAPATPVAG